MLWDNDSGWCNEFTAPWYEADMELFWSKAAEAVALYTCEKMWVLYHIPMRYYIPGCEPPEFLTQMYRELDQQGRVLLDAGGRPCCITGRQPKLAARYDDYRNIHGPWKEEP